MSIRTLNFIVQPGETYFLAAKGDYVRVKSSAVTLTIEGENSSDKVEMGAGDDVEMSPFTGLQITHTSGVAQAVKLLIGEGKKAGSAAMTSAGSQGAYTQSRVSLTNAVQTLLAANTSRMYAMIQNNDTAAAMRVTLDGSTPTATAGFRVEPGGSMVLDRFPPSGAIKAIMEVATATANNVEIVEG